MTYGARSSDFRGRETEPRNRIARRLASPGDVRLRLQHPPALPGASRGKPHGLGIKGRASPEILTRSLRAAASGFTLDTQTSPGPPRSMARQTTTKDTNAR